MSDEERDNFFDEPGFTESGSFGSGSSEPNREDELSSSPISFDISDETKPSLVPSDKPSYSSAIESNIDHRFESLKFKLREYSRKLVDEFEDELPGAVKSEVEKQSFPNWAKWALGLSIPALLTILTLLAGIAYTSISNDVETIDENVEKLDDEIQNLREDFIQFRYEIRDIKERMNETEESSKASE